MACLVMVVGLMSEDCAGSQITDEEERVKEVEKEDKKIRNAEKRERQEWEGRREERVRASRGFVQPAVLAGEMGASSTPSRLDSHVLSGAGGCR